MADYDPNAKPSTASADIKASGSNDRLLLLGGVLLVAYLVDRDRSRRRR